MPAPTCSESSLAADEPLPGSAPHAAAWMCLEQVGPWGAKAFTGSHLDPVLGSRLEALAGPAGVRAALVRRPGRHADLHRGDRAVLLASTHPDRPWLLQARISDPTVLLDLDWDALGRGDRTAVRTCLPALTAVDGPVLLVCTNGARDACCARLGRPVAVTAAASHPGRVWEVTHTSGHRFAPTTVLLPSGYLHGRVLDAGALLAAADRGRVVLAGLRGRSAWPPAGQVAEARIRAEYGIEETDGLVVEGNRDDWTVSHRDGRTWQVRVTSHEAGTSANSCGKEPTPVRRWQAAVGEVEPTR